jgi:hypothetical protein
MRSWLLLSAMYVSASAGVTQSTQSHVTTVLSAADVTTLKGCWHVAGANDRWIFSSRGPASLQVVHEVRDSSYADRARMPHDVMFDPTTHTYAFAAAGMIHALLGVFTIRGSDLYVAFYSSHTPSSGYHWTGDSVVFERCPR